MSLGWQDIVSLSLVLAALVYLGRHFRRAARGSSGCGSCRGCSQSSASQPLVTIDLPGSSEQPGGGR